MSLGDPFLRSIMVPDLPEVVQDIRHGKFDGAWISSCELVDDHHGEDGLGD